MPQSHEVWAICPERIRWQHAFATQSQAGDSTVDQAGVAIISVRGVLQQRSESSWWFSGASAEQVGRAIARAVNNTSVSAVVLDIDSPGGIVAGMHELWQHIADFAKVKPIYAIANSMAMSAAYWIATAVGKGFFFAAPQSDVGAIGVFIEHWDASAQYGMMGIAPTLVQSSPYKTELADVAPLTDGAREHLQGLVDASHKQFVADVARGRGVSPAVVDASFGQGRYFDAADAMEAGMIDGIMSMQDLLRKATGKSGGRRADESFGSSFNLHTHRARKLRLTT